MRKIKQNKKSLDILCAGIVLLSYFFMLTLFITFFIICYKNRDISFYPVFVIFLIYLTHIGVTIKNVKKGGWKGLL